MFSFTRLSLARQFLIVSFIVLFGGMLILGAWVGRQIEIGVINRTAAVTALSNRESRVIPTFQK
ncbi:MAG: hypothetical protein FJ170_02420 [Gammaproteobacteria bacterium]|nr:hypothetical protein [Gammaproteobacteria bacterium]